MKFAKQSTQTKEHHYVFLGGDAITVLVNDTRRIVSLVGGGSRRTEWEAETVGSDSRVLEDRDFPEEQIWLCRKATRGSAGDCARGCLQGGVQLGDDAAAAGALGERRDVAALMWLGASERVAERGYFFARVCGICAEPIARTDPCGRDRKVRSGSFGGPHFARRDGD